MIGQFLILLAVHWVADFVLQTHWQASNKSKNLNALGRHVGVYTIVLVFTVPFIFPGDLETTFKLRANLVIIANGPMIR